MKSLDDQIDYGLSLIIGALGGNSWTNETVAIYRQQFSTVSDGDCFIRACQDVLGNWESPGKPPPRVIYDAYKSQIVRRELERPTREIEEGGRDIPAWRDGVEIARRAYHAECAKLGKEPDDARFESMLAKALTRDP